MLGVAAAGLIFMVVARPLASRATPASDGVDMEAAREAVTSDAALRAFFPASRISAGCLELTASNQFLLLTRQQRLQIAQIVWSKWANATAPGELDRARIRIVDATGNKLAGSSAFAGSVVSLESEP